MPQHDSLTASPASTLRPSTPTTASERFVLLDALRGFALLGVVLVNLRSFTLFDLLPENVKAALPSARWDRWLDWLMNGFVDGKSFTLFTLLFGVGFALQMQRADGAGDMRRYIRRLLILLIIGLGHAYLFWWGDILRLYATMGLLLVPLGRLKTRTLAALGVFVAVFLSPLLRPLMVQLLPGIASADQASAWALAAFSSKSLAAMLKGNFDYDVWSRISAWGLPLYVLGRLMIGAALGRTGALYDPQKHSRFWQRLTIATLPLGAALTTFILFKDHNIFGSTLEWWRTDQARAVIRMARSAASLSLGLAYVGIFALLFQRPGWRRWMQLLAPVGRMALTNYLAQTVLGIALFYGVGLGIGPRFGLIGLLMAGAAIFTAQIVLSHWWLARFNFGPFEWLWRSLTYGHRLPLRRTS